MARDGLLVNPLVARLSGDLVGGDVRGAVHAEEYGLNIVGDPDEGVEVVAIHLDAEVGSNARNHLVHSHFNRLRVGDVEAGEVAQDLLEGGGEAGLGRGVAPLIARVERDEDVGELGSHGVGGDFGGTDAAPDVLDFIGEFVE